MLMNFIPILIPSHTEAKYSPGLMSAHSPGHACLHYGCTASQMPSELTEPPVYPTQASVTNQKYNTAVLHSSQYQKDTESVGTLAVVRILYSHGTWNIQ
jgi:hypothetical protein